ncbi:MAG TPA: sulfatase-like hydrolase/transferase [Pseudomonadales bacterium]|nr:sulfatase-like hydrolase/transferase [Pseudomonadales bacterium]
MLRKLLLPLLMLFALQAQAAAHKPNILLIVLDDAGYSDVAGFGRNDAPTPNIRKIADEGVRFTRHYADSTCKPARLALMTGRTSASVAQSPDFRGISPQVTTLAEALKLNGYSTHHVGKWHIGDSVREAWPDKQGFDSWFGFLNQFMLKGPDKNGKFTKRPTYLNPWLQSDSTPLQQYQGHLEDILADKVIEKIHQLPAQKKQPWFINYWLFAPHHPSQASDEYLAKYDNTPQGKYLALLAQADAEIGRVIQTLRDTQQLDNTLIVLVSDNGGTNEMMNNNAPFAGVKGGYQEGSLRTPLIIRWPDKRHGGEKVDDVVAIQDIYPTLLGEIGKTTAPRDSFDGQDLHPLLKGEKLAPRPLVHEMVNVGAFNYSWLTADGNWRLSNNTLYDLQHDPASATNVAATFPQQQIVLQQAFSGWRSEKTKLVLDYKPVNNNGAAIVLGDDFRRAPGYGAFSFAITVDMPAKKITQPVYIAEQKNIWSLRYNPDNTFTININSQDLASKAVKTPDGKLNLLFSTTFTRSRLHEGHNHAFVQLQANGEKILQWQQDNPTEIVGSFDAATYIGQRSDGSGAWPAPVGKPQFWNANIDKDEEEKTDPAAEGNHED